MNHTEKEEKTTINGNSIQENTLGISESENKYYECFGDWWEHQVNFITRGSGLENGTSSDLKLGCGHSGSVILSVDGQSIPDKNNLGNGELKQEPSHNTTYFIELKGEAEMSKLVRPSTGSSTDEEMRTAVFSHNQFINRYCLKRPTNFLFTLDKWFTRSLTLVTVLGIIFLFWVQNSEYHIGVELVEEST